MEEGGYFFLGWMKNVNSIPREGPKSTMVSTNIPASFLGILKLSRTTSVPVRSVLLAVHDKPRCGGFLAETNVRLLLPRKGGLVKKEYVRQFLGLILRPRHNAPTVDKNVAQQKGRLGFIPLVLFHECAGTLASV